GNVWEWTSDWYSDSHPEPASRCCAPVNLRGVSVEASRDPASGIPRKVLKGGSFLCAENYCSRYRPAARIPESIESSTVHISFRCVRPAG
ncbi:MAG: SUMF1/EgtB/PvdO family nonheme iron enzyme, partial [Solirubrobacterales bacterium]|nr:SUMF1/EgtB/PvdO family nonheme iron enzyme [Solirubrobacterales bacterium]